MEHILTKIKEYRKNKGYTYEKMADELNTSPAAYRKIELNQTKLTVVRLYQITNILEAKVEDILDIQADKIYKQKTHDYSIGHQEVENLFQENKEKTEKIEKLYEERLKDKDILIKNLQIMIDKLNS
jgi:transcriptional regulator with XRE-family HTH domain